MKPKKNFIQIIEQWGRYNLADWEEESLQLILILPEDMEYGDKSQVGLGSGYDETMEGYDDPLDLAVDALSYVKKKYIWTNRTKEIEAIIEHLEQHIHIHRRRVVEYRYALAHYNLQQCITELCVALTDLNKLPSLVYLERDGQKYWWAHWMGYGARGKTGNEALANLEKEAEAIDAKNLRKKYNLPSFEEERMSAKSNE